MRGLPCPGRPISLILPTTNGIPAHTGTQIQPHTGNLDHHQDATVNANQY